MFYPYTHAFFSSWSPFLLLPVLERSPISSWPQASPLFPGPGGNSSFMSKHLFIFSLFYSNRRVLLLFLSFAYSVVGIKITPTSNTITLIFLTWKICQQVILWPFPVPHCHSPLPSGSSSSSLAHVLAASPTCLLLFSTHANYHLCPDLSGPCHTFICAPHSYASAWSHSSLAPHRSQPW